MEKDIALGPEANAFIKIEGGKVSLGVKYAGVQTGASAIVDLDIEQFANMLKAAIPGTIDDTVIDLLIAAMKVL